MPTVNRSPELAKDAAMARRPGKAAVEQQHSPRGLNRLHAATYIGVSLATFERLVADGLMPPARAIYSLRIWDIVELDRAFDELPHATGSPPSRPGGNGPLMDFV